MARVAFLACEGTLPGSPARRADAFEHDRMVEALRPALAARGHDLEEIAWDAPLEAFEGTSLALLGTAWDYQDRLEAFLDRLEALAAQGIAVCNSPDVVRWNGDKRYLRALAEDGVPTVPTLWLDDVDPAALAHAFTHFDCDRLVVKRQVGAGAEGQEDFFRHAPPPAEWRFGRPAMVQPFQPSIAAEGEYSFVFAGGAFSHAIRKIAAPGEYRIQSVYGGREEVHAPSPEDIATAEAIHAALPFDDLLYARIDMIRLDDGTLAVMEAECIEPYLYPREGPLLGERLAEAISKRLL